MNIHAKLFFTYSLLAFATALIGLYTVGNAKIQAILSKIMILFPAVALGHILYLIWGL